MQPNIVKDCLEQKVHTMFLVANSSHFLQPLDDLMYTNFKKVLSENARKPYVEESKLSKESLTDVLIAVAPTTEEQAFTTSVITASFQRTGIWPFNPEIILNRAQLNCATQEKAKDVDTVSIEDCAKQITLMVLEEKKPPTKTRKIKTKVSLGAAYTPDQLFELHEKRQNQKEKEQKEKEIRQKEREEKKKRKLEDDQRKKEEQESRKRQRLEKKLQ